jgi:hypothetical protein
MTKGLGRDDEKSVSMVCDQGKGKGWVKQRALYIEYCVDNDNALDAQP